MNTFFARVDASAIIGSGHVTRIVALAEQLLLHDVSVEFICSAYQGNLIDFITKKSFTVHRLPANNEWDQDEDAHYTRSIIDKRGGADWLLVDRYGIDAEWDRLLRPVTKKIMAVDDLANVKRDCDILLNQNYLPGIEAEYHELLSPKVKLLLGPQYALLRHGFADMRACAVKPRSGNVKRVLVALGGGDNSYALILALEALRLLRLDNIDIDIVAGQSGRRSDEIKKLTDILGATLYGSVDNMEKLTAKADLVIGALGVSTWERMCLGAMSIVVTVADVQERVAKTLADDGYIIYLGRREEVSPAMLAESVNDFIAGDSVFYSLSKRGMSLVDGNGAKRVATVLLEGV